MKPDSTELEDEFDVFFSYSHDDNTEFGGERWFSTFRRVLVEQMRARKRRFWQDEAELRASGSIHTHISRALRATRLLMTVVGHGYVRSPYCLDELEQFAQHVRALTGAEPQDQRRIIRVEKEPVPPENLPEPIRSLSAKKFYRYVDGRPVPYPWWEASEEYFSLILDVVHDIEECLRVIEGSKPRHRFTVYLADSTEDVIPLRNKVHRELLAQGALVLPQAAVPVRDARTYREHVRDIAKKCDFSVHVFGTNQPTVPEGGGESTSAIQWSVLGEREDMPGFHRICWVPQGGEAAIRAMSIVGSADPHRVTIVRDLPSRLYRAVVNRVRAFTAPKRRDIPDDAMFLIATRRDRDWLRTRLEGAAGVEWFVGDEGGPIGPPARGSDSTLRIITVPDGLGRKDTAERHQWYLERASGWLLFHHSAAESWLQHHIQDFLKYRAARASRGRHLVLHHPESMGQIRRLITRVASVALDEGLAADAIAERIRIVDGEEPTVPSRPIVSPEDVATEVTERSQVLAPVRRQRTKRRRRRRQP